MVSEGIEAARATGTREVRGRGARYQAAAGDRLLQPAIGAEFDHTGSIYRVADA